MQDKDLQEVRGDEGLYRPSDGELLYEWDTAKKWTACLNRVELTITPRSEGASVSGPSQE